MKHSKLLILAGAMLLAGPATVLPARAQSPAPEAAKPIAPAASSPVAANDPDYKIGPQDVLTINVWKEPDVSREVPVRPDGKISLPLLNDVEAAGLTPMQLANSLTESLKKFISSPQVTVIVKEINSRRVYVIGEVVRAGTFPLLPKMTVLQIVSSCGGFTQFANPKKIYVLRTKDGKQTKIPFNYREVVSGKNPEQNIELQPGDTIVVP
ncbi:MAG TPA: polysaccharide biosynthesis/export family protein [Candidatus Limnocylindrales bacterium]|nr:polysaccharide biosynthesis/export family protein [Candidatus Limnocylindrales bacterium]